MTYIDIVNGVLRRLREREVTDPTQSTYSKMVGDYVNDAKRIVEDSWDWSANRFYTEITTVAGQGLYSVPGYKSNGKLLSIWNDTTNTRLRQKPQQWFDERKYRGSYPSGSPTYYCWLGTDEAGDSRLQFYPTPDDAYTIIANTVIKQPDLVDANEELRIPTPPVLHLAVAMLAEEKGEAGGYSSARYFEMADKFLSDAVAFDASKNPSELIWHY